VKSLTNALEYQRRRSSAASEASATLQQRICSLEDEVTAKDHQAGLLITSFLMKCAVLCLLLHYKLLQLFAKLNRQR
jgi:hypothetical protein